LRAQNPHEWQELQNWFTDLGIKPILLGYVVVGSRVGRRLFEQDLEAPHESPKAAVRRLQRALKHAEPLIRLPKTERDQDGFPTFAPQGKPLEAESRRYLEDLRSARVTRVPAHRPGDPWMKGPVLVLAWHLRACQLKWPEIRTVIHRILTLAGHADRTTPE